MITHLDEEQPLNVSLTHTLDGIDWDELAALYRAAGLGNKSAAGIKTAFMNSQYHCFARDRGKLIGVGRVLADGADCAYLCDVAVLPDHQGRGIGAEIVGRLVAWAQGHRKILLYAMPGKEEFYRRFGFQRMCTAMGIFADREQAQAHGFLAAEGACTPERSGGKSTASYWNVFSPEHRSRWTPVKGLEGMAEELTLSLCPVTGEYTRLTRFLPGADTSTFGARSHPYPEEVFIVSGRLYDAAFARWLEAGHYASRPPGELHGPFQTDNGCVVLELSFPSRTGNKTSCRG